MIGTILKVHICLRYFNVLLFSILNSINTIKNTKHLQCRDNFNTLESESQKRNDYMVKIVCIR